jgi:putative molybdopterin biosynthesis protein
MEKTMEEKKALSTQDVANMLNVGKSTIYGLIKNGEMLSYKVGRKVRFTESDVYDYINRSRTENTSSATEKQASSVLKDSVREKSVREFVICGQDIILDILSNYMRSCGYQALRAYIGSYDSLTALYRNKVDVATAHLWDGESKQYNIPYVKYLLPGIPTLVIHFTKRMQGFFVAKGNPKNITSWHDFSRSDIVLINREFGAGSRVLLDENLKLLGIACKSINGYETQVQSHFAVASAVGRGEADVGIGIEKIAKQIDGVDFVPLQQEKYDLVIKKEDLDKPEMIAMLNIIRSDEFKKEFKNIGGYDIREMGEVVKE